MMLIHLLITKPSKIIATLFFILVFFLTAAGFAPPAGAASPIPLLAYYEIAFDLPTWEEREDLPLLGRYSSDDGHIMREHIKLAQSAGIQGFIVGWHNDQILNRRLAKLVEVAQAESFYLAIRYQSEALQTSDDSLSAERAAAQLDYIATEYGDSMPFQLFERPLILWAALSTFPLDEIEKVQPLRNDLLMLVSMENEEEYHQIAHLVDGNALFRESNHEEQLASLGRAVHRQGGLWIAPISTSTTVELNEADEMIVYARGGQNLRRQMNQAIQSAPDAMAIISWNDFEANTHIEPSEEYGTSSIDVLKEIHAIVVPAIPDFDSSEPGETLDAPIDKWRLGSMAVMVGFFLMSVVVLARRDMKATKMEMEEATYSNPK